MSMVSLSPGLVIPRSSEGFFRHNRQNNPLGMALFALVARDLLRLTESVPTAGRLLADLASDVAFSSPGFSYWSNQLVRPGLHRFEATATSAAGADHELAASLWQLSEALLHKPWDRAQA